MPPLKFVVKILSATIIIIINFSPHVIILKIKAVIFKHFIPYKIIKWERFVPSQKLFTCVIIVAHTVYDTIVIFWLMSIMYTNNYP